MPIALDHRLRRLGRDVIGREARAARREDERELVVDEVVQAVLDEREVVGDHLHGLDVGAGLLGEVGEQRPGRVLGLPAGDGRRDRQDRGAHRRSR
jgi:hypothetical protein